MRLCLVIVLVFYMSTHVRLMRCDHISDLKCCQNEKTRNHN